MSVKSDIRDGLIAIFKMAHPGADAFSGEVKSVDTGKRSCIVTSISGDVETEYGNVWLMPQIDDGILYVPKVGSTVIVQNNDNMQPYVCMWSALDKILYAINKTAFTMTDGLTQFNDGSNGGIPNVIALTQKINALENLINQLQSILSSTVIPLAPSGTYPFAPLYASTSPIAPITQQADIEDTKVTH